MCVYIDMGVCGEQLLLALSILLLRYRCLSGQSVGAVIDGLYIFCRYDGQTFVKPPEVLARDRLLGAYEVIVMGIGHTSFFDLGSLAFCSRALVVWAL